MGRCLFKTGYRQAFRTLSKLVIVGRGSSPLWAMHPWVGGPGFYRKAGWARYKQRSSKQHPSGASASVPAFRFLLCFCSCPTSLWWIVWKHMPTKPFCPQPASFVMVFHNTKQARGNICNCQDLLINQKPQAGCVYMLFCSFSESRALCIVYNSSSSC